MPALPPSSKFEALIELAMKDRAPNLYRALMDNGQLSSVIKGRERAAREKYYDAMSVVISHASLASRNLSGPQSVNEVWQGQSRAAEEAITQAVDFFAPQPCVAPNRAKLRRQTPSSAEGTDFPDSYCGD